MSKILLLGINARYTHSNLALLYLKSSIAGSGHDISVAEYSTGENPKKIFRDIVLHKPDVIAMSVYIWNASHVQDILKNIKSALPDVIVVLGGPEVSYDSTEWAGRFSSIDHIITGGGEAAFRELALSGFNGDKRIIGGCNPHFSRIAFPYTHADMESLKGRYVYYESSRGCPFRCSYCLSSVRGHDVEFRSIEQVSRELDFFSSYSLPLVKFVDRTFNLKKDHYMPVWENIAEKFSGSGTCFHFEIFPELLDEEDLRFLAGIPSGLFQFEMGIQSAKAETLKEINRTGTWDRLECNIRKLAEKKNIHLHMDLIAGLPLETFSDFSESFNKVYSLGAEHFQAGFLKLLPGTEMRSRSAEYGMEFNPDPPYEISSSKWLGKSEMERLKTISALVDLVHNQAKFQETEKLVIELYGGPFAFYNRLADFFVRDESASHRRWEYRAACFISMVKSDRGDSSALLMDTLRWDWCVSAKIHHYPELIKPGTTAESKRRGLRFFKGLSHKNIITYGDISFPAEDLRRSIFFAPETEKFRKSRMNGKMALFLPDKRILFFNPD